MEEKNGFSRSTFLIIWGTIVSITFGLHKEMEEVN